MSKSITNASVIYRSAESVSPKHPDKICDLISDAVLDAYLAKDPEARVAIDVAGGHGTVFITGEVTSTARVDVEQIALEIAGNVKITTSISEQSPEIAQGVDTGGAGDQGIMIGYACDETPELLPLEVVLARNLNQFIYERYPQDGKTQITLKDDQIVSVVASFQNVSKGRLNQLVNQFLASDIVIGRLAKNVERVSDEPRNDGSEERHDNNHLASEVLINPAGDWSLGGFDADSGLTGRKLVVDNYGPRIPIGGGAFSGKDPSKVDRSAAYMARKIAIDYLKARNAHEVFVRLAYAIGYAEPLEATVIIDGVEEKIIGYDLTPRGIVKFLKLKRPIYSRTAEYGHFGHPDFSWEA